MGFQSRRGAGFGGSRGKRPPTEGIPCDAFACPCPQMPTLLTHANRVLVWSTDTREGPLARLAWSPFSPGLGFCSPGPRKCMWGAFFCFFFPPSNGGFSRFWPYSLTQSNACWEAMRVGHGSPKPSLGELAGFGLQLPLAFFPSYADRFRVLPRILVYRNVGQTLFHSSNRSWGPYIW